MENPADTHSVPPKKDTEYKGTSSNAAWWNALGIACLVVWPLDLLPLHRKWRLADTAIVGAFGAIGIWVARSYYKQTKAAEAQHNELVQENQLMRTHLNHAGQLLNHVADNLTHERDALSAKIEARSKGTPIKPASTHVEQVMAEKQSASQLHL